MPSPRRLDWALLAVRLAAGLPFIYHGSGILFNRFDGPGIAGFASFTHLPEPLAALVGLAEFLGGLAILTGVLTRLGAACTGIVMIGAIGLVHWPHGFDIGRNGAEYALTQLLISAALILTGAGDYSLVRVLPRYRRPAGAAALQV